MRLHINVYIFYTINMVFLCLCRNEEGFSSQIQWMLEWKARREERREIWGWRKDRSDI